MPSAIITQLPPKQGLRRHCFCHIGGEPQDHNPTSTKTRIKTNDEFFKPVNDDGYHNPTSTKTRIKTLHKTQLRPENYQIITQLPPKQGLRLPNSILFPLMVINHNPTSTKTRIKTIFVQPGCTHLKLS